MHEIVTLLSLSLTAPVLVASIAVVALWWRSAMNAFFEEHKTGTSWFVIGVVLSFLGSVIDNSYWFVAWLYDYLGRDEAQSLFRNGVYSNLPFRQGLTLLAAMCHIIAAVSIDNRIFRICVGAGFALGLVVFGVLLWAR